jgi:hypothetical protein
MRLLIKLVLGLVLLAGLTVLFVGHQLFLHQRVASGSSPGERLLIAPLVPKFESTLGTEAMLAEQTVRTALTAGGVTFGLGALGLFVMGLQDSARARRAARLVAPPVFDDRDLVSSFHFVPDGVRMWAALYRLVSIPCFLLGGFLILGIYAAVTHEQWGTSAILVLVTVGAFVIGALLWRGNAGSIHKHGVERLDVMRGGLRWVRFDDPTVRAAAWSQVGGCQSHHSLSQPWKNTSVLTLRTGETIKLWACCLTNYDACLELVERGRQGGGLSAPHAGNAGIGVAFRF